MIFPTIQLTSWSKVQGCADMSLSGLSDLTPKPKVVSKLVLIVYELETSAIITLLVVESMSCD
jgi:hypothetical protein